MIIFLLLFWFVFTHPILAAPQLNITNTSGSVVTGNPFSVSFTLSNGVSGDVYYAKVFGGLSSDGDIKTLYSSQELSYTNAWTNFPAFTLDIGGSYSGTLTAKVVDVSGQITLKMRVAPITNTSNGTTAPSLSITVISPTPIPTATPNPPTSSPTPLPTIAPTSTPYPSSTPVPTNTLTPTLTPTPTSSPTPTLLPTDIPLPILTPVLEATPADMPVDLQANGNSSMLGNILGSADAESSRSASLANVLPLIFIISGGLLLTTPLIITKVKTKWPPKKSL